MLYICKNCGWTGEEGFTERNGDPYVGETKWWTVCPECFELIEEDD